MKILFIHYFFKKDGVFKVILNNILGLKAQNQDIEFMIAGESFIDSIPNYVEKRYINWNSDNLVKEIERVSSDADIVIIENPSIGMFPKRTLAFKEFAEKNPNKKIIYRIHDLIEDKPHLFEDFKKTFNNFNEPYPSTDNVSFLVLTSFDKNRLLKKGLKNVHIVPNSIIESDLYTTQENSLRLRKIFEENKIVLPDEKIISYPVRVLKRKNIEEALLITKLLNDEGENYRLIVTIPCEEDYQKEIEKLAEEHNIPCSVGEAHKFLGYNKEEFTTADLFHISDLIISTSIAEGFGFAFIEPWIAGTPLIGRKIPEVTKDFENNGIDLSPLYDNNLLYNSKDSNERMRKIKDILSDREKFQELKNLLDLNERIKKSRSLIDKNREVVIKNYNHINVAKQLLDQIMPDYNPHLN
jgi:hypothetical protein